ncbi:hypothetical protein G0Q06_07965 [Puniceicoccales bacterium CK1056]|uniref:VTT domain-containing protein n=1 Tax=Oceanipulchritudo coccoides TaxID=2706888 RepID=A0A6B2M0A1_9BACT|nr:DedA family protein [Oceanipulchritudo coccoides]NDV62381.1 hypothetical protein [Oceanipulchritudo coccoides]
MNRSAKWWLAIAFVLLSGVVAYFVSSEENAWTLIGIFFGTFVSEDLASISAGLLSGSGQLDFVSATAAAFLGIFVGDLIIFGLGYFIGRPILCHRWSRWLVSERAVDRAQRAFEKHGIWIILMTRFIPGTRTATYFSAGSVHAPVLPFVLVFALAALLWTPLLVGISAVIGKQLIEFYEVYEAFALPAILFAGLALYFIFHYGIPLLTWRGRRQLRGKWMRAVRWEFWPVWQVNWAVLLHVVYLGLVRYRRPMLVTAVNPCMPHGGIIGESKGALMQTISPSCEGLLAWEQVKPGTPSERIQAVREIMAEKGLKYPVVLKPDEGQRGLAVEIIPDEPVAHEWLGKTPGTAILQEYAGGKEYGIFYARFPSKPEGRIISITRKEQLSITGNGEDTVEDLIYQHPRAIAMLNLFLARFDKQLDRVPDSGEEIPLGQLGTHALGSLFLDGKDLLTPELSRCVDRIAKAIPGFYFGRFDFKAEGDEALKAGRGLKVLEVNGATSESTHIYDPQYGLFHAWQTLFAQWRLAHEIALENAAAGVPVSSFRDFVRDILAGFRRQRKLTDI